MPTEEKIICCKIMLTQMDIGGHLPKARLAYPFGLKVQIRFFIIIPINTFMLRVAEDFSNDP